MNGPKPDVTDEDIGMRAFQIRKERAVERATDRMRRGLGHEWDMLSQPEIELMSWALGELWAFEDRADWEELHFSKVKLSDIRSILGYARELQSHGRPSVDALKGMAQVVQDRRRS